MVPLFSSVFWSVNHCEDVMMLFSIVEPTQREGFTWTSATGDEFVEWTTETWTEQVSVSTAWTQVWQRIATDHPRSESLCLSTLTFILVKLMEELHIWDTVMKRGIVKRNGMCRSCWYWNKIIKIFLILYTAKTQCIKIMRIIII